MNGMYTDTNRVQDAFGNVDGDNTLHALVLEWIFARVRGFPNMECYPKHVSIRWALLGLSDPFASEAGEPLVGAGLLRLCGVAGVGVVGAACVFSARVSEGAAAGLFFAAAVGCPAFGAALCAFAPEAAFGFAAAFLAAPLASAPVFAAAPRSFAAAFSAELAREWRRATLPASTAAPSLQAPSIKLVKICLLFATWGVKKPRFSRGA